MNAFEIVKEFEAAVGEYTGAPYVVAVNSCTSALFLALKYFMPEPVIEIPRRTYISVPMQIIHAGSKIVWRNENWKGGYILFPTNIWDYAKRFTSNMYYSNEIHCVSFHWSKILGIQVGGAILHDSAIADEWYRKARFDGRTEGVPHSEDNIQELGYHMYMSPEVATLGLIKLGFLPKHNEDQTEDYPDLSKLAVFNK